MAFSGTLRAEIINQDGRLNIRKQAYCAASIAFSHLVIKSFGLCTFNLKLNQSAECGKAINLRKQLVCLWLKNLALVRRHLVGEG